MSPESIMMASRQTDLGSGGAMASLGLKDALLLHMLPWRQSRHSDEAHDTVRSLAESWGVTSFDHFRRLGVSFSSTVYPSATLEGLESACAHLSLWILLDDLCFDRALDPRDYGIASHIRRGASGVGAFLGGLCDLFRDPHAELPPGATPAETASWELGVEMRRLSSADWMDVFADHVEGYVAANLELAEARGKQRVGHELPAGEDLDAYTRLRVHTSGCTFAAALVELTTGAVLPAAVRAHPAVQQLTRMAVLATCFANDIFSYHNETALEPVEGDFHPLNVIQLFMDKDGLGFDRAAHRAVQLVNSYASAFLEIEARLPQELDEEVEHGVLGRYVHGLKEYMSGWFHWHYNSNRYRSPGQPFPELRNRVVTPQ